MKNNNQLNIKEHSLMQNLLFCMKNTIDCYPLLLLWCLLAVLSNVGVPVLATFLPKVVIEKVTSGASLENLVAATLLFTLGIAVLSGFKHFWSKFVYYHKYKMNAFYLRKVANKGLTTDYCNQEN